MRIRSPWLVCLLVWLLAGQSLLVQAGPLTSRPDAAAPQQAMPMQAMQGHEHHAMATPDPQVEASAHHAACGDDCHCTDVHCAAAGIALSSSPPRLPSQRAALALSARAVARHPCAGYAGDLIRPPRLT